ncbi:MAG: hypothetical protein ACO1G5_03225 [Bacteroidota bacterium]
MSITLNESRIGRFTSSEIYKLLTVGKTKGSFGKPALTYIEEKKLERELCRSLDVEVDTKVTSWGHLCEIRVNDLLELKYQHVSNVTIVYSDVWSGSTDFRVPGERIAECKAYQPKKFIQYSKALIKGDIDFIRENFEQEYWQGVSNAIINGVPVAELISYMPYEFELDDIRSLAQELVEQGNNNYRWVINCDKQYLPYLPDHSLFRSFNRFEFEVPQQDKERLISAVERAGKLLIQN